MNSRLVPSFVTAPLNKALNFLLDPQGTRPDQPRSGGMHPPLARRDAGVEAAGSFARRRLATIPATSEQARESQKIDQLWQALDAAKPGEKLSLLGNPGLSPDHPANRGTIAGLHDRDTAGQIFMHLVHETAQSFDAPRRAGALRDYLQALPDPDLRQRLTMKAVEGFLSVPKNYPQGDMPDEFFQDVVSKLQASNTIAANLVRQALR